MAPVKSTLKYQSMTIFISKTLLCPVYKYITIYYVMLKYRVISISEFQVNFITWSKDSHSALLSTTIHQLEAKPVHEA